MMRRCHRIAPRRPYACAKQARLDPFGQVGRAGDRLFRHLSQPPRRQPFGQRIDRFLQDHRIARFENLVGMHHLALLPVNFQLAGHQFRFAKREELAGVAGMIAEIGQAQIVARAVDGLHPQRPAHAPLLILDRRHDDADLRARQRIVEPLHACPHDRSGRQMEQDVDYPREAQPCQRLGQSGAYTLQRLDFGE